MTDPNQLLLDEFVHQRGTFSKAAMKNYVDPDDLRSARYHHSAGLQFLELAKKEESKTEVERLRQKAKYHFHELDLKAERAITVKDSALDGSDESLMAFYERREAVAA